MFISSVFLESLEDLKKVFIIFKYLTGGYLFSKKLFAFLSDKVL